MYLYLLYVAFSVLAGSIVSDVVEDDGLPEGWQLKFMIDDRCAALSSHLTSPHLILADLVTYITAADAWVEGRQWLCFSHRTWVCVCVLKRKRKRLELLTPNLVDIQCMTVVRYALTRSQKVTGQGHAVMKCAASVGHAGRYDSVGLYSHPN